MQTSDGAVTTAAHHKGEGRAPVLAALGVVVFAGLVFLWDVGVPALWLDEAFTVDGGTRSWGDAWQLYQVRDAPNGLFYLLLKPWLALSTAEWWVRLPSVLAMVTAAGCLTYVGARRGDVLTGLSVGSIFVLVPWVSRYAQEARPYALMIGALCVAAVAWVRLGERRRPVVGAVAVFAVASAVAVHANVMSAVVVVSFVLSRAVLQVGAGHLRWALPTVGGAAAAALLTLPQVGHLATAGAAGISNVPSPGIATVLAAASDPLQPPALMQVLLVFCGLGVLGVLKRSSRELSVLAMGWVLVTSAVLAVLGLSNPSFAIGRYWVMVLPGLALLAGCGTSVLGRMVAAVVRLPRARPVVVLTCSLLVGALGLPLQQDFRLPAGHQGQDPRPALALLASPTYRSLPVVNVPSVVRVTVATYDPALLARMPLAQDPGPAGQLVVGNLRPELAVAVLEDFDEVAVLGYGEPAGVIELVEGYDVLEGFEVVETEVFNVWTVMRLVRAGDRADA